MRRKQVLSLSVPPDVRAWVEREAGERRMTMSDFVLELLAKGIQADTIDRSVARLEAAVERGGISTELLRQTLATRFMVEKLARGEVRTPATIGYDADQYAAAELTRRQGKP
ncbi:hypothetical protein ACS5PK_22455 [Roseateles sp. DB2]|uniref:hypothetical protein n=1 Tax=Roseateles sp. DB2 TaxID=3453717 RepID=UPI003EEC6DE7